MIRPAPSALSAFLLCGALAPLVGCAAASPLPDPDRHALLRSFEGKVLFLRTSLNVLPFFADDTRHLASPLHADSIHLLDDTKGVPIMPGAVVQVIPLGTKVRIEKVEFPTGLVVSRRPLYTPRDNPWVYLALPGFPRGRPFVVVLRQGMTTGDDYRAALNDLFSDDEPSLWMRNVSAEIRRAIEEKRLVAGMDAEQVMLSWGRPEHIRQTLEAGVRLETWTWPLKKRTATLRDGKLAAAAPPLESAAP
ncbi:MAG: hypothetical protein HY901_03735 [Deltaproteobacteria bacterium]|nr:hypothetical protein [Deltaproteobacteria bacterium]